VSLVLPATVLIIVPLLIEDNFRINLDALAVLGALLCLLGLFMLGATIKLFIDIGRGTLAPWDPTQKLVTRGLYAHVRNPMITGVLIALLGEAMVLHSVPIFIWFIVGFVVNHIYFIASEEPGLMARFGQEYLEYKKNVPRWIPRLRPWKPGETQRGRPNRTQGGQP
jgi:protein-S-isoprenylcysteine O-methyltransferase Ste14